jgi:ribosomal protein S3AE
MAGCIMDEVIRTQLYLKVEFQHSDASETQKLTSEISRAVKKIYGVRHVEIQNSMSEELPDVEEEE